MANSTEEVQKLGELLADSIIKEVNEILQERLKKSFSIIHTVIVKSNLEFQIEIKVDGIQAYLSPVFNIFSTVKEDDRKTIIENIEDWDKSFARFIAWDVEKQLSNGVVNGC
jgi:hypothetical protein